MTRTNQATKLRVLLMAIAVGFVFIPAVLAAQGRAKIYVEPEQIPKDGTTYIHITVDTTSGPSDFLYFEVEQVAVAKPPWQEGEEQAFMLGTATVVGIAGQKFKVYIGDDISIPFGPAVGPIIIKGNTYYWWMIKKDGSPIPAIRIDDPSDPSPTQWEGKYQADMAGHEYYGSGPQDIRLTAWFNIWDYFYVPEFGITLAAAGLISYMVISIRKKNMQRLQEN